MCKNVLANSLQNKIATTLERDCSILVLCEKQNYATLTTAAVFYSERLRACFAAAVCAHVNVRVKHIGSVSRYLVKSA